MIGLQQGNHKGYVRKYWEELKTAERTITLWKVNRDLWEKEMQSRKICGQVERFPIGTISEANGKEASICPVPGWWHIQKRGRCSEAPIAPNDSCSNLGLFPSVSLRFSNITPSTDDAFRIDWGFLSTGFFNDDADIPTGHRESGLSSVRQRLATTESWL